MTTGHDLGSGMGTILLLEKTWGQDPIINVALAYGFAGTFPTLQVRLP